MLADARARRVAEDLQVTITMHKRRCEECRRWFASEEPACWKCGQCATDRVDALLEEQTRLEHVIRGLRSALTRARAARGKR